MEILKQFFYAQMKLFQEWYHFDDTYSIFYLKNFCYFYLYNLFSSRGACSDTI